MSDHFGNWRAGLTSPAENAYTITPNSTVLSFTTRALYIGGAGDITITTKGGSASVPISGLVAGTVLPIRVTHVLSGATASAIVGFY